MELLPPGAVPEPVVEIMVNGSSGAAPLLGAGEFRPLSWGTSWNGTGTRLAMESEAGARVTIPVEGLDALSTAKGQMQQVAGWIEEKNGSAS